MKHLIIVLVVLLTGGCTFFQSKPARIASEAPQTVRGRILDKDRFLIGGDILLIPFSPGEGVVADQQTERTALMIVKSLAETLQHSALRWHVLGASEATEADIIVQGYITEMHSPSKWGWFGAQRIGLAVEGKITDTRTGDVLAEFKHTADGRPEEGFLSLGERVGRDLAAFILLEKD